MSRIIGIGIGLGFTYGGAGGSVINPTLAAPTLVWDEHILDLLPDFTIAFEAQVADIVTLRRSTASDFGTYEEVSDTVDSIDPANTLEFDFGGDWATGTWYVKAYYTRSGVVSSLSSTETIFLETQGFDIDFINSEMVIVDTGTPANDYSGTPQAKLTKTVSANGTYIDANGVITQKTANTLHLDHSPTTYLPAGVLVEEGRTNVLLNSLINGTNLSTQTVAVTAQAYTLSFYGTGTITLSGASTAGPLVGTGAYPTRVTLTFTPSAANLTLTVSGTVQYAQLEAGSFVTSFIPTAGSAVTRASTVITLASNISPYSGTASTLFAKATVSGVTGLPRIIQIDDGSEANRLTLGLTATQTRTIITAASSAAFDTTQNATGTLGVAVAAEANSFALSTNGATPATDGSGNMPTGITTIRIGAFSSSTAGALWIRKVGYVPRRMTNAEIQVISA